MIRGQSIYFFVIINVNFMCGRMSSEKINTLYGIFIERNL